jgi:hypothetical protein
MDSGAIGYSERHRAIHTGDIYSCRFHRLQLICSDVKKPQGSLWPITQAQTRRKTGESTRTGQ